MNCLVAQNYKEFSWSQSLQDRIQRLSRGFMEAFALSHVWVSRYYFDGRYLDITNDLTWKEIMVSNNHYADFITLFLTSLKAHRGKSMFFTWTGNPHQEGGLMNKIYDYGINSGFNILRIQGEYVENFGFGSSSGVLDILNKLPHREELDMFCLYLREEFLKMEESQQFVQGNTGVSFQPALMDGGYVHAPIPQYFTLECHRIQSKLTCREILCLAFFARGYSIKECAYYLGVSPRTTEYHLNQMRLKFGNAPKLDLIKSFSASPLACVDPFLLLKTKYTAPE